MNALPLQFLMVLFAGWVNRRQQDVSGYLRAENRALREQFGGKQMRFINSENGPEFFRMNKENRQPQTGYPETGF